MSFYKVQFYSSVAIFIAMELAIWLSPAHLIFFDINFANLTLYYIVLSWVYTLGFFVKSEIELKKSKSIDLINHEQKILLNKLTSESYSLKERNERLQKRVQYLEGVEKNFEAYKIQNRSAKEANQQALQSFL